MSKGGGHDTQTIMQNNTPFNAAQLTDLFGSAKDTFDNNKSNYYPGASLYIDPSQATGYNMMRNAGTSSELLGEKANDLFSQFYNGYRDYYNSPAYGPIGDMMVGHSNPQWYINDIANSVPGVVAPFSNSLQDTATGEYLNANPYLDRMYGAASDAVTRAYQTATAPQTDSAFERAGRYGSGAMMNARSQNEQNLGNTLDNLAATIYGGNYANERQLMNSAASAGGALGLNAAQTGGALQSALLNSQLQAAGLEQSGYNASNADLARMVALYPSLVGAAGVPGQTYLQGAQGLTGIGQSEIQDAMNRYYGNQQAPWQDLQKYAAILGSPVAGTQTTTQPLYSNPMASVLGTGLAGASLLGMTGAFGGAGWLTGTGGLLGGLFGSGAAPALSAALVPSTAASLGVGGLSAIGLPLAL